MNKKDFYEIEEFVVNETSYFLIWCSPDEGDVYFLFKDKLLFSINKKDIEKILEEKGINYEIGIKFDFGKLLETDCEDFLNKWNIIDDLSKSIKETFIGNDDDYTHLYTKFVCGSNIPALNKSGKKYIPVFSETEKEQIENVKNDMLRILKIALGIE